MTPSVRSDGLILCVRDDVESPEAAKKLARRAVADQLPGKWVLKPLGEESHDFAIRRPQNTPNPTPEQAFDFAHRLRRHRDVKDCEAALVVPTTAPEPMRAARFASSSGTTGGHLACSMATTWALDHCFVPQAWALTPPPGGLRQGESVIVGHPDTGYTNHPEISDPVRLLPALGFSFEENAPDPRDTLAGFSGGHGTSTGSVIMSGMAGRVTGVAPKCRLVPLRVTSSVVLVSFSKLTEAIYFAADKGHHVLSISLGGPLPSPAMHRAIKYAVDRGVILCCAAGNVWPFVVYPARYDEVVACAAGNCQNESWRDSASGRDVDITAPGESVWRALTTASGFDEDRSSGTSYATALTAGAAALWLAFHGRDNLIARFGAAKIAAVFKEVLITGGFDRPPGWDTSNFGAGVLNAKKLLSAPLPSASIAAGMHALRVNAAPRVKSQVDELIELFPGEDPAIVRHGLMAMLHTGEEAFNERLMDVADEIAWHAVTDMPFRSRLISTGTEASRRPAAVMGRAVRGRPARKPAKGRKAPAPAKMSRRLRELVRR